jgi:hypothetical protein
LGSTSESVTMAASTASAALAPLTWNCCSRCSTPPSSNLQGFLAARDAVLDLRAARDAAKEAVAAETAQQDEMRLRFAQLMPEADSASLPEAIAAAHRRSKGRKRYARNATDSNTN